MKKNNIIKKWIKNPKLTIFNFSIIFISFFVGFIIADYINNLVHRLIDSFILDTLIGVGSLYCTFYVFSNIQFIKD
ncbi:hypothetical protein [Lactococcus petauri]|uniref:hypothetical protein n=1 Tax=Lactococcus petauri TaxID=1940789 RepID=UPI001F57F7D0|nr:hypothetical protein [Lactococcus petauri]